MIDDKGCQGQLLRYRLAVRIAPYPGTRPLVATEGLPRHTPCPALLDPEVWIAAQEEAAYRRRRNRPSCNVCRPALAPFPRHANVAHARIPPPWGRAGFASPTSRTAH